MLKTGLSDLFRKVHRKGYAYKSYHQIDFISCADNNEISWLKSFTSNDDKTFFVVHKKGFEQEASRILGNKTTIQEAFELLDIQIDMEINKDGYQTSRCGVRGAILSEFDLIYKLFGMKVYDHTNLIEDYEAKKEQEKQLIRLNDLQQQGLTDAEIMGIMKIDKAEYDKLNNLLEIKKQEEKRMEIEEEAEAILQKHQKAKRI